MAELFLIFTVSYKMNPLYDLVLLILMIGDHSQNGLMVACCKGFIEIVYGLHSCPFIDINQQDNEGNTALMIASQAGESHLHTRD